MRVRFTHFSQSIFAIGCLAAVVLIAASRPVSAQTTFERRVATGNDDAEQDFGNGEMDLDSTDLELAISPEGDDIAAMRFTNITVPQGATITNAYIQFKCDETSSGTANLTIMGQAIDDAPGFTSTSNNISSRTEVNETVPWTPPAWNTVGSAGANERTPNISAIIQEIVDRGGWVSGNDLVLGIYGTGTRTAESYNGDNAGAPLLHIEYTSAPTTYYVRPDGNNSNAGTGPSAAQAWQTIAGAATKSLTAGDIVYVKSGTYTGTVIPSVDGVASNLIHFIADSDGNIFGDAGGSVIIAAPSGQNALDMDGDNYLRFVGFEIDGDSAADTIDIDTCSGIVFERCEIHSGLRGVEFGSSSSAQFTNCLIRNNADKGIYMSDGTMVVSNCTIVANTSDGIELDGGTMTLTNSIIANQGDSGLDYNSGTLTHTYNLVWGNGGSNFEGTSASTGEISQDPQFTSGYQLSSTSPAIDTGTSSGSPPTVDILGNTRPQGSGYDMGAYEYLPAGSDLLGHWKLDETTGTSASDSSSHGNDGTLNGGVTFDADSVAQGRRGAALNFNGTSDYIQVSDDATLRPTTGLSMAAFVKGSTWSSADVVNIIVRKGEGNPNNYQFAIADGRATLYLDDSDSVGIRGDTVLENNRWYHVAATWDGAYVRIYVDGVLDATPVARSGTIGTDNRSLYLGGRSGTDYFHGALDDIRFYGRALSASEVIALYGLIGHWKLDENSGSVATDSSGVANDGVYYNGAVPGANGPYPGVGAVAAEFYGDEAQVSMTEDAAYNDVSDEFSVAVWFNFNQDLADQTHQQFLVDRNNWSNKTGFSLMTDQPYGDRLIFRIFDGTTYHDALWTESGIAAGDWHHVVGTFDGSNIKLYVDGELRATTAFAGTMVPTTGANMQLGRLVDGRLFDARVYSRTLSPSDVSELYGLIGHWKLDETSGSLAADASGLANDATLIGLDTWETARIDNGHRHDYSDGDDYFEVPNTSAMSEVNLDSYSLSAWFKPLAVPPGSGSDNDASYAILVKQGWHTGLVYNHNQQFEMNSYLDGEVWNGTATYSDTFAPNTFYHIAGVVNRTDGTVKIYVDGVLLGTNTFTPGATLRDYSTPWRIGLAGPGASQWGWAAYGITDDVRIYNRPLSIDEVSKIYASGAPKGLRIIKWVEVK